MMAHKREIRSSSPRAFIFLSQLGDAKPDAWQHRLRGQGGIDPAPFRAPHTFGPMRARCHRAQRKRNRNATRESSRLLSSPPRSSTLIDASAYLRVIPSLRVTRWAACGRCRGMFLTWCWPPPTSTAGSRRSSSTRDRPASFPISRWRSV